MNLTDETDIRIYQHVLDRLAADPRLPQAGVGASVDRRVVTLTGTVDSWARRAAAEEAIRRVDDVSDIVNRVHVVPRGRPADEDLAERVRLALEWDALVPHERIRARVSSGRVVLDGDVLTQAERADAEAAVGRLSGVVHVENRLEVRAAG